MKLEQCFPFLRCCTLSRYSGRALQISRIFDMPSSGLPMHVSLISGILQDHLPFNANTNCPLDVRLKVLSLLSPTSSFHYYCCLGLMKNWFNLFGNWTFHLSICCTIIEQHCGQLIKCLIGKLKPHPGGCTCNRVEILGLQNFFPEFLREIHQANYEYFFPNRWRIFTKWL